jgi:DNA-binding transcriptional LysR family regulator
MLAQVAAGHRRYSLPRPGAIDALYGAPVDTRVLEYFVTVAAEQNVTQAARQLFVAQSSVSVGLQGLERELGVRLFDRGARAMQLTAAGEQLLPEARAILDGLERMKALGTQSAEGLRGRLRVGTFTGMDLIYEVPAALQDFRATHPGVEVRLAPSLGGSSGLAEDLLGGRLDIAFVALPDAPELDLVEMSSAPYIALLPPGHPLGRRPSVTLAELAGERWVDASPGFANRLQLERALAERGLARQVTVEVAALPAVSAYVAAGLGVAVVPDIIDTAGCTVLALDDAVPRWTLSLAARRGGLRRPAVSALAEIFRSRIGRPGPPAPA